MPSPDDPWPSFEHGHIRIDRRSRCLHVGGLPQKLSGRAFDLLVALAERCDRVVPKHELMQLVWPHLVVEENNLQVHVMALRKVIGAQAIVTVPGRGYQLALHVDDQAPPVPAAQRAPAGLIGRATLLTELTLRLREHRLVTLCGPGGAGKTRLALHAAGQLASAFGSSHAVLLAPVRESAHVMAALATALGVHEGGPVGAEELVIRYLRDRSVLLVLDNCEHLPSLSTTVATLLARCHRLHVLATSRAPMHVDSELLLRVPPLAGDDALALFVQRAAEFDCVIDGDEERAAARAACRRLDGLPLAIELAAARLRTLTPAALAARLGHCLPLLAGGAEKPERQRTLRATIGWSHDLLAPASQRLFRRLAVFVGGCSLEAAEAVAGNGLAAIDALEQLLEHNLVQRDADLAGQPRYSMLETIREFALEQLTATDEAAAARASHAGFCLRLATTLQQQLTSAARDPALALLRAEINNLREALTWLVRERGDVQPALQLCAALTWLWYFEGLYSEGRRWMTDALALPAAAAFPAGRAAVLSGRARLAGFSGDFEAARGDAEQSIALWRTLGDARGLGFALFHLGIPALFIDGRDRARAVLQESVTCFEQAGDAWGVALATAYQGTVLAVLPGTEDEAVALLEQGLARADAVGDPWIAAVCHGYLGDIAGRRGDHVAARAGMGVILAHSRATGDRFRVARSLQVLARVSLAERRFDQAQAELAESLALSQEQGRVGDLAPTLRMLVVALAARRIVRALVVLGAAASRSDLPRPAMPPTDPAPFDEALARCRATLGDAGFDAAWREGSLLDIERATTMALALHAQDGDAQGAAISPQA
jgi:predicted ATPase/DNA-binding winged helix-turn-helix (wHTH) protein